MRAVASNIAIIAAGVKHATRRSTDGWSPLERPFRAFASVSNAIFHCPAFRARRVLASVVKLMAVTFIRVGNPEYARTNNSFGLTTLRDRHVEVSGSRLQFQFRGKGGKEHTVEVSDPRLARIVKRCQDIPGYELFQYIDENGERRKIDSSDVNEYLRSISRP